MRCMGGPGGRRGRRSSCCMRRTWYSRGSRQRGTRAHAARRLTTSRAGAHGVSGLPRGPRHLPCGGAHAARHGRRRHLLLWRGNVRGPVRTCQSSRSVSLLRPPWQLNLSRLRYLSQLRSVHQRWRASVQHGVQSGVVWELRNHGARERPHHRHLCVRRGERSATRRRRRGRRGWRRLGAHGHQAGQRRGCGGVSASCGHADGRLCVAIPSSTTCALGGRGRRGSRDDHAKCLGPCCLGVNALRPTPGRGERSSIGPALTRLRGRTMRRCGAGHSVV
mmetsp:Transcript_36192/g.106880  ORF Transcript_36192/g.106880 Transcript_36192/m.106880 type:complete len:277 (+) Transcript_36192:250-1080(+)